MRGEKKAKQKKDGSESRTGGREQAVTVKSGVETPASETEAQSSGRGGRSRGVYGASVREEMDAILGCSRRDLEDYYGLLGCDELSTTEQIISEFKVRALACHPDKHPEDPNAVEQFQKLQEAKETLSDEKKRQNYDLWRCSGVLMPFHQWQSLQLHVRTSLHWASRSKKELMIEAGEEHREHGSSITTRWSNSGVVSEEPPASSLLHKFRTYQI